jgi:hypothetical protein
MMLKPRAKEAQGSEDGITQWRSQSTASQRRAEYPHLGLGVGEKSDKKGSFGRPTVFIAGGKRELRGGPLVLASDAGVKPDRRAIATC